MFSIPTTGVGRPVQSAVLSKRVLGNGSRRRGCCSGWKTLPLPTRPWSNSKAMAIGAPVFRFVIV
jgi:hypothetical protein